MHQLEKILYVEDDPDIREIASMALEDVGGFTVKICESGEHALQAVTEFQPQVVLLDVMMPGMDGPATLLALKKVGAIADSVLVIFMTAKVHSEDVQRYKALGVNEIIAKPFDSMTLADDIRAVWDAFNG